MQLGKVEVTPDFLLLAAWLNYWDTQGILWFAFLACALHELGHIIVLKKIGIPISSIRITASGADMRLNGFLSYQEEFWAALAGPCVNLILAVICCHNPNTTLFAGLNLALGLFNLLPAGGLDGSRVLYSLLCLIIGPVWATNIKNVLSALVLGALCAGSLFLARFGGNITLAIVAAWLMLSVYQEKGRIRTCQEHQNRV